MPSTIDADGWNFAQKVGNAWELCAEMCFDAMNQQVDSKNFQWYVPIQMYHMFICDIFFLLPFVERCWNMQIAYISK